MTRAIHGARDRSSDASGSTGPRAILVADLGYGDCGKGTVVDDLTRRYGAHTVVRFNGGPQAGHNVVVDEAGHRRHHTFAQFGSGSFVPGVRTLLSRFVLVEPYALFNEAAHLAGVGVADALDRLMIDARCPVITPAHQAANRLREVARGDAAHGTCGMGVGEAVQDSAEHPEVMLRVGDLSDRAKVARRLRAVRDLKVEQLRGALGAVASVRSHPGARFAADTLLDASWIDAAVDNYAELARRVRVLDAADAAAALRPAGTIVFEGAQGVLLDEWFGFHPHTTWSTTTFANADALLDEAGYATVGGRRTRLGVVRAYFTRHGPGPLVTEDEGLRPQLPEPHNADAGWQGRFRVGPFDAVAARYALAVAGGVNALAVTHLDRLSQLPARACNAYDVSSAGRGDPGEDGPDCFDYFDWLDGHAVDIRVRRPADLAYQERLTRTLRRCRPVETPLPGGVGAFLAFLRDALRSPVGIASFGPTARDKHIVDAGWLE